MIFFTVTMSAVPMKRLFFNPGDVIRRHRLLTMMIVVLIVIMALGQLGFRRLLTVNLTGSLPRGLYMKTTASPAVGALVEFRTPASVRDNLDHRFDYLLKPVAAGPGDEVDTTSGIVFINGRAVQHSALLDRDSKGRALSHWRAKRKLSDNEFFVLSTRVPNSLDSRYFGPIKREEVQSVRSCLWEWDEEQPSAH